MRDLIIRNVDDALILELKRRAWHQGLPFEESLRRILASVVAGCEREEQDFFVPRATFAPQQGRWHATYGVLHA